MNKVVWITVLDKEKDQDQAKKLYQMVSSYGLAAAGHFWRDNLFKMSWAEGREDLVKKETALWIIVGSAEILAKEDIRYGLSMLALGVFAQKGQGFPILVATTGGEVKAESLPTPLKGADVLAAAGAGLGPKIVAKANMPIKNPPLEYRLDVYGMEGIGQWFEVGPAAKHSWNGVMFGVSNGEISVHGVGPSSRLPERSVVEYAMKGLKLQLGETEYTAWAVKNQLATADSYYLKVKDYPKSIVFGPLGEGDDAEVFVVHLK
ncbi:MAG: hypothetical protein HQK55_02950 [Deltaproteobacteria bacterium]|nr:hypothetical protein [Deltaproteobacteria bacterium]